MVVLAEQTLNNRPLTSVTECIDDLDTITPNMLLNVSPCLPLPIVADSEYHRKWFKNVFHISGVLWRRFLSEYILALQDRQRWLKPARCFTVNDLVLLIDEAMPRGKWPLGRVIEVVVSEDGLVRTVVLKTSSGVYRRPANKCVLLEAAS